MSTKPEGAQTLTTAMSLRLGAILCWCVLLLLGALPPILTPWPLQGTRFAVHQLFDSAGIRSGSFVFAGRRGDAKRRFFAMRAYSVRPDKRPIRLHESPDGLRYPKLRWMVSVQDTLSFKMFPLSASSRLYQSSTPEELAEALTILREGDWSERIGRYFCASSEYDFADPRDRIYVEVYWATVSYATGELSPHRETVIAYDCDRHKLLDRWPKPTGTPDFPGVTWE